MDKEVTKKVFYEHIGLLDVVPVIRNSYSHPYTTDFKLRHTREIIGTIVDEYENGKNWPLITKYYLKAKE